MAKKNKENTDTIEIGRENEMRINFREIIKRYLPQSSATFNARMNRTEELLNEILVKFNNLENSFLESRVDTDKEIKKLTEDVRRYSCDMREELDILIEERLLQQIKLFLDEAEERIYREKENEIQTIDKDVTEAVNQMKESLIQFKISLKGLENNINGIQMEISRAVGQETATVANWMNENERLCQTLLQKTENYIDQKWEKESRTILEEIEKYASREVMKNPNHYESKLELLCKKREIQDLNDKLEEMKIYYNTIGSFLRSGTSREAFVYWVEFCRKNKCRIVVLKDGSGAEQVLIDLLKQSGVLVETVATECILEKQNKEEIERCRRADIILSTSCFLKKFNEKNTFQVMDIEQLRNVQLRRWKSQQMLQALQESIISGESGIEEKIKSTAMQIFDIDIYLDFLKQIKEKYLIVLTVRDTPGCNMPDYVMSQIIDLGFSAFKSAVWTMYKGVMYQSLILCNHVGEQPEIPIDFADEKLNLYVSSQSLKAGNKAAIRIDEVDVAVNVRGLNIAVYDMGSKKLVDSIGFDSHRLRSDFKFVRKI